LIQFAVVGSLSGAYSQQVTAGPLLETPTPSALILLACSTKPGPLDKAKFELFRNKIGGRSAATLLQLFETDISSKFAFDGSCGDATMIENEAHTIAGAAGLLGFDDLALACRDLEAIAAAGQPIHAALDRCRQARDLALAELSALSMAGELILDRADETHSALEIS
jgi:HPt (histidine-containing phosphotransfer) domain-containing protein